MKSKERELPERILSCIADTAKRYPEIMAVILFGSWAMGNAKPGSDIDLALSGSRVDGKIVASFHAYLDEETNIPYFFDVVHLQSLSNAALNRHILEKGRIIYSRQE